MIEVAIWTHIGHPYVRVDNDTLSQMKWDAEAGATGTYRVLWCNDEKRTLVINWSNVIMLEYLTYPTEISAEVEILLPGEPSKAIEQAEATE